MFIQLCRVQLFAQGADLRELLKQDLGVACAFRCKSDYSPSHQELQRTISIQQVGHQFVEAEEAEELHNLGVRRLVIACICFGLQD